MAYVYSYGRAWVNSDFSDFSTSSSRALAYARALAAEFGASLHLLHVIEERLMTGPWPAEIYLGELPKVREDLVKDAEHRMQECLAPLAAGGTEASGEVLIGGPSHVIVEQANVGNADLIVMGTHGRPRITPLLIGSVAERVIRQAPCPVFVVRERKAVDAALEPAAVAASGRRWRGAPLRITLAEHVHYWSGAIRRPSAA